MASNQPQGFSLLHTMLACIGSVAIYGALIFIIPVIWGLLDSLASPILDIGNRFATEDPKNPSVYSVLVKLAISSGGAAIGTFSLNAKVFPHAHAKTVATVFCLAFLGYLALGAIGTLMSPTYGLTVSVLMWLAMAVPTFYFIRQVWHGEFFLPQRHI